VVKQKQAKKLLTTTLPLPRASTESHRDQGAASKKTIQKRFLSISSQRDNVVEGNGTFLTQTFCGKEEQESFASTKGGRINEGRPFISSKVNRSGKA